MDGGMTPAKVITEGASRVQAAPFVDFRAKFIKHINDTDEKRETVDEIVEKILPGVKPVGGAPKILRRMLNWIPGVKLSEGTVRFLDLGTGNGHIFRGVLEALHARFKNAKILAVGKEFSAEDVRLTMDELPARLTEHEDTVVVLLFRDNKYVAEIGGGSAAAQLKLNWHVAALEGTTTHELRASLHAKASDFVHDSWKTEMGPDGKPVKKTAVLVLYRADRKRALRSIIPKKGKPMTKGYNLAVLSHGHRLAEDVKETARKSIAHMVRALAPAGKLVGVRAAGRGPAFAAVQELWPDQHSYKDQGEYFDAVKAELRERAGDYDYKRHTGFDYGLNKSTAVLGTNDAEKALAELSYASQIVNNDADKERELEIVQTYLDKQDGEFRFCNDMFEIARRPEERQNWIGAIKAKGESIAAKMGLHL